jgi:ubiquinone/menaquinone biosynthesis C-methylase UbiE
MPNTDKIVAKNIASYDEIVDEYFENTKKLIKHEMPYRKKFMAYLKKKDNILDVACGFGRDAKIFSEKGFKVIGADLSKKMLEKARKVAPKAKFKVMDFLKLDFKSESFEGIWFNAALLSVPKKTAKKVLCDLNRILKPSGIIFVSVKEGKGEEMKNDHRYGVEKYFAYFENEEIENMLEQSGFEIIWFEKACSDSSYYTHPWLNYLCKKNR